MLRPDVTFLSSVLGDSSGGKQAADGLLTAASSVPPVVRWDSGAEGADAGPATAPNILTPDFE